MEPRSRTPRRAGSNRPKNRTILYFSGQRFNLLTNSFNARLVRKIPSQVDVAPNGNKVMLLTQGHEQHHRNQKSEIRNKKGRIEKRQVQVEIRESRATALDFVVRLLESSSPQVNSRGTSHRQPGISSNLHYNLTINTLNVNVFNWNIGYIRHNVGYVIYYSITCYNYTLYKDYHTHLRLNANTNHKENEDTEIIPRVFFGQCSEICGINHRFIPIILERTDKKILQLWDKRFTTCDFCPKVATFLSLLKFINYRLWIIYDCGLYCRL
ncbi:hypothetical protein E2986_13316 [Frieseomelitta varia]|uniref:Cytochrome oxidase subunit II copper A binding domain-containing protein n=1 Tax=Frieseomelitta varia TaxID=561572 RepID=A0A833WCZ3_9HYME|nr:hypothetical protein E2986_13316 [Frieseomelitta varia]